MKNRLNGGWVTMLERNLLHCQFVGSRLIYYSVSTQP